MKNILIGFLLSIILIIGTASTTISIMTIKPAIPTSVISFNYGFMGGITISQVNSKIIEYSNRGYIVKSITPFVNSSYTNGVGIVIMEKY